jgi:hypothetical protein
VGLSRLPALELNVDAGASHINFDATNLKLQNLTVDGGASQSQITIGTLLPKTTINIDGGAMNLVLLVPKAAGLKITDDSGLSSSNISDLGLTKTDSTYTSTAFDSAAQQLIINFDAGAAHLTITRY